MFARNSELKFIMFIPFGILSEKKSNFMFFLVVLVSRYVLTIFWVSFCGFCMMIFWVGCCCKGYRVDWKFFWNKFFLILKSTGRGNWLFLFSVLGIVNFEFYLNFPSSMIIFFPLKPIPFNYNKFLSACVGMVAKANSLDFSIFSHLISSK